MIKRNTEDRESGIGMVEVMVAMVIIAGLLVATAATFATTSAASSASANRNQAIQLSQNVISTAKQAPWEDLAIWTTAAGGQPAIGTADTIVDKEVVKPGIPSTCSTSWTGTFGGRQIVKTNNYYPGLRYCSTVDINGTDQVYTIYTNITYVLPNVDAPTVSVTDYGMLYNKKVTVTVVWFDGSTTSGETQYNSVTQSYVRAPSIAECIPYNARKASEWSLATIPTGCKYQGLMVVN